MTITNYAIIDHAGSVGANKALYNKAFSVAKNFEKVYTLKAVCQEFSPFAREITQKMKYFHRYNRNPRKVFIVCASQFESKAQFIANIWESRNIPVEFIEENPAPSQTDTISPYRRCAMLWSQALGWQFSAPLIRDPREENIDMYTKRPNMERESGSYAAKRTTNPHTYRESFRNTAPESECIEFFEHWKYFRDNHMLRDEYLEPGWRMCPHCRRPIRESADHCDLCDTQFEAIETETFWDDSYNDDSELNYEPERISSNLPSFADIEVDHAELATRKYRNNLVDIRMMESCRFCFD